MSVARPIRVGMVGGGAESMIGEAHRQALREDGLGSLVAGVFSSDAARSRAFGHSMGVERAYGHYEEMAEAEAAREDGVDAVSVVTPNGLHAPVALAFIRRGIHVICDKPLATTLADAQAMVDAVRENDVVFALTHTYTGYPMVKQARAMVEDGAVGTVRKVVVSYSQGWLSQPVERQGNAQAMWRTDPLQAGAGTLADIGSHAHNLATYVTGLQVERLCADVRTFVEARAVDDDANVLLRFVGGAGGVLHCSQIAAGLGNDLRLCVIGTEGTLTWNGDTRDELTVHPREGHARLLRRGHGDLSPQAYYAARFGSSEVADRSFANVYRNALRTISARVEGREPSPLDLDFPTVEDGLRGVRFFFAALESGRREAWVAVEP